MRGKQQGNPLRESAASTMLGPRLNGLDGTGGRRTLYAEPPPPPPRQSVSTSCDLHPEETFTGFCTACLRERLAGLEASAAVAAAPGRKSTSAIRSLFSRPFAGGAAPSSSGAAPPDLRRCKSFSCGGRGGDALAAAVAAGADEPQRWSCDWADGPLISVSTRVKSWRML